jgi:CheY-like chemotaxis protein
MLLQLCGHQTQTAYDGLEAVQAATAFQPDVVLLDLGLPKLDGFEAARRIREDHANGGMMLVALSGWGQEEDRRRTTQAGFDAHLVKPVDPEVLIDLLASRQPASH